MFPKLYSNDLSMLFKTTMRKINKYILVLFNCFENFPLFILKCSPLRQSLEEIVSLNLPKPLDPPGHQQPIGVKQY